MAKENSSAHAIPAIANVKSIPQEPQSEEEINTGHWTEQENFLYMVFIDVNKMKFKCRQRNKKIRVFEEMAKFIGTRSSIQCRTHHQKYEHKFGSPKNILKMYRESIGHRNYRKHYKQLVDKEIIVEEVEQEEAEREVQLEEREEVEKRGVDMGVQVGEQDFKMLEQYLAPQDVNYGWCYFPVWNDIC